jgi:hypothetical protein
MDMHMRSVGKLLMVAGVLLFVVSWWPPPAPAPCHDTADCWVPPPHGWWQDAALPGLVLVVAGAAVWLASPRGERQERGGGPDAWKQ